MFSQWCGGNATSKEQTQEEVGVDDSSGTGSIFSWWTLKILSEKYFDRQKGNSSVRFGSWEKQMIEHVRCVGLA
jgi:hypothetical protein